MQTTSRVVLGTLHLDEQRHASFELRAGRWLADDPGRCLRWHDGPFEVDGDDTVLRIANDMGPAIMLHGCDPASVGRGQQGEGVLIEAGDDARPHSPLRWQITSVVD